MPWFIESSISVSHLSWITLPLSNNVFSNYEQYNNINATKHDILLQNKGKMYDANKIYLVSCLEVMLHKRCPTSTSATTKFITPLTYSTDFVGKQTCISLTFSLRNGVDKKLTRYQVINNCSSDPYGGKGSLAATWPVSYSNRIQLLIKNKSRTAENKSWMT